MSDKNKQGRATTPIAVPETNPNQVDVETNQSVAEMQAERDYANQLVGRIQMGQGIAKLATVATTIDLKRIKDTNGYKHLTAPNEKGELATVATWEQFCELIGKSRRTIDEQIQNLEAFGQDALDSMKTIGLTTQQLRQLRKLPDEDRKIVIEQLEIDTSDKESVKEAIIDLLETQAKKKDKEIEKAQKVAKEFEDKLATSENAVTASKRVAESKEAEIRRLNEELVKHQSTKPSDLEANWLEQLKNIHQGMQAGFSKDQPVDTYKRCNAIHLRTVIERMWDAYKGNPPETLQREAATVVVNLRQDLDSIADQFGLFEIANGMSEDGFTPNFETIK